MAGAQSGLRWSELITAAGVAARWDAPVDPLIHSIEEDSRQVKPGAVFVAMRGTQADGHAFIGRAVEAGASAVICERAIELPASVPVVRVQNARGLAGRLAAVLHGIDRLQRAGRFQIVGITGTNGKSTFCYLMRSILRQAGCTPALFGTIEYDLVSRKVEASMTTPPATTLMAYLAEAASSGATHAVMEVSSHALDQGRCEGIRFSVGTFSNLTGDHLDYHKDMASYLRAKKRLFDGLDSTASAVINQEDPASDGIVSDCPARIIRYGVVDGNGNARGRVPEVSAGIRDISAEGTRFDLVIRDGLAGSGEVVCEVNSPLVGRHNVQNSLAAVATALSLGISPAAVVSGLLAMRRVPGRLERVESAGCGFSVLVDYAHTDDAMTNVLSSLRPLAKGRLIVLFGCGGDRDKTKRPRMAHVAAQWADLMVVTSDNPRNEDPQQIISDILVGFEQKDLARVRVESDRRRAIAEAIGSARPGDIVLLAGKGHETYQIIGTERLPFDDAAVAAEMMGN